MRRFEQIPKRVLAPDGGTSTPTSAVCGILLTPSSGNTERCEDDCDTMEGIQ